jgi:hypothetical protein
MESNYSTPTLTSYACIPERVGSSWRAILGLTQRRVYSGRPSEISAISSTPIKSFSTSIRAKGSRSEPRFYSDRTDTVPIAVPALVRNWWPMLFFTVFKSPAEGRTHIFRPGEPFAQVIVLPEESEFTLSDMTEDERADRELRARRIHEARSTLSADTQWTSRTNTVFDGTYRHMLRAAKANKSTPP